MGVGSSRESPRGSVTASYADTHAGHGHAHAHTTDYTSFRDVYSDLPTLQRDLRAAGLESSNLIIGVDFTKSNTWTGARTFGGKCLHDIDPSTQNPYQQAITAVARTLSAFDDDGLIPAYGFGSAGQSGSHRPAPPPPTTSPHAPGAATAGCNDSAVFSFMPGDAPCHGLPAVLARYCDIARAVTLAGPTSFAPIIRKAIEIVRASGNAFHVLVLIADGQVRRCRLL